MRVKLLKFMVPLGISGDAPLLPLFYKKSLMWLCPSRGRAAIVGVSPSRLTVLQSILHASKGGPTMNLVAYFDRIFYPGVENYWDDRAFRAFVIQRLKPEYHVLDLGAGAGVLPEMNFLGQASRICGVDPDPRVTQNPYLHEGQIGHGERIPYLDNTFDIVLADNVLEHLTRPDAVFAEIARVLKPGGRFLFKTPNRMHYMPLIASLTPQAFHAWFNRKRGRASVDTFPTAYRANTEAKVSSIGRRTGLEPGIFILLDGRPEYLRVSALTYLVGIAYERLVSNVQALSTFRVVLMGELLKSISADTNEHGK